VLPQEARFEVVEELERQAGAALAVAEDEAGPYAPLRWDEVAEMARSGLVSFGGHSHTHAILTRCPAAVAEEELAVSKRIIEDRTGTRCTLFSYPNGERGDFDRATRELLVRLGYACGLTTVPGLNPRRADVYELKRTGIGNAVSPDRLLLLLSGLPQAAARLRRVARVAAG
jgi:peptidoglycan/xylan/chitin deacetylase (PgdA/CDA1 family)